MPRPLKVVALLLLAFLAGGSLSAEEQPKAAAPAYLLSAFVGFGTGQYYCGANGIGFLVVDIVGVGVVVYGLGSASGSTFSQGLQGAAFIELGGLVLLVSRIGQIINVFGAVERAKREGRLADVVPVINVDIRRTSFELGVALRY